MTTRSLANAELVDTHMFTDGVDSFTVMLGPIEKIGSGRVKVELVTLCVGITYSPC